ncbi:MAG: hypothetical protein H0X02_00740, partial [Nitrosomonas sp.]|nr:hypothetical protein [Nitrosomonas sp.]
MNTRLIRKMNVAEDLGLGSVTANDFSGGDVNETFDDMDYESESSKEAGKKFEDKFKDRIDRAKKAKESMKDDEDEKPKKADKKESESKKGSDLDMMDDDEAEEKKPEKKEEKKTDKKDSKKENEEETAEEKGEEGEKGDKAEAKKLKIRMSDGLYGIEPDAKVRVKIDGAFQEVPVQELINNYSGKTSWDKKFSEIGNEKKVLEQEKSEVTKTKDFLQNTLSEVIGHLNDPNKNPFDALYFLVEKSGHDNYSVYKRAIEANLEEVEKLMSMSEIERKSYFLEKKDEFRTKTDLARNAESAKGQAFNQALQKVDSLRQAHGVSEEQFLQTLDQLESDGVETNKLSDEYVVDHASLKPHVDTVQDVLEPYEDSLDDT